MARRVLVEVLSPILTFVLIITIAVSLVGAAANPVWPLLVVVGFVLYIMIRGWLMETLGLIKDDDDNQRASLSNGDY